MHCEEAKKLLQADVDGELDAASSAQLAAHVAGCAACEAERAALADLKQALKQGQVHAAPEALRRRIAIAIRNEAEQAAKRKSMPRKSFKPSWAWLNGGFAGAGALAFAFMFSLYLSRPSDVDLLEQDVISGHARSMMVSHLSDVASTDQHTVKPWFADKLDFSPNVADFSAQGYPLVGGRLDYIDRHNVAAIVYHHRLHTINLYEWPERGHTAAPALSVSREGYQLQHWTAHGMNYWLVSDLNAQELNEFKGLLVAQVEKSEQR
ncbi:MAG TPA: zf-HC2 domain-containing protein [Burkholderiaceae bacterium]